MRVSIPETWVVRIRAASRRRRSGIFRPLYRPARAPELAEVIADAYALTARERRVTELVAQGLSNAAIAAQLHLSTYTIQDHLKAIFEKLDVSSRGELVARLFVNHQQVGAP